MRLTTERLIIRDMQESDIDSFYPLCNADFVTKYLLMYKMTRDEALDYIRQMMEKKRDFTVALRDGDRFIGKIHLDNDSLRFDVNSVELAYWVGEPYARRGYMTEALHALLNWLFAEKAYDVVSARVLAPNTASQKLLETLGFTREGCIRKALNDNGTIYDDVHYSMLKEEFEN
ncbi:MAG: GNAT family protein [Eubacteriales bacterium]|nr:GNAT family protein [Eubacteriales bacterium]